MIKNINTTSVNMNCTNVFYCENGSNCSEVSVCVSRMTHALFSINAIMKLANALNRLFAVVGNLYSLKMRVAIRLTELRSPWPKNLNKRWKKLVPA